MSHLIGQKAPDFTAQAVMENDELTELTLSDYLKGSYGLIFFYPLDFTFVCPSEIIAFSNRMDKFAELNTKVVGVSVDSQYSHYAWRNTPPNKGGLGPIKFPLVADLTKQIAKDYGVLIEDAGVALRGSFLIDKEGNIRHYVINDLPLGRNVDESIRMVEALQFHEEHGEVCPAGWQKGQEGMKDTAEGVASYLASHAEEL
ncbi:peroxiredoxin [Emcibacter nanhaiensis]|uniref:Thioredoxin peroxidase n=1 Tax=Emcibacter nanhaiensis TaxID=1505037 RepID=A0A501PHA7_9PROT|nr:peroxiredoxin [Emcibacter nanhaiensis]TPD59391.1 peroxiredoxin [Emcibacter nanhaiensis]